MSSQVIGVTHPRGIGDLFSINECNSFQRSGPSDSIPPPQASQPTSAGVIGNRSEHFRVRDSERRPHAKEKMPPTPTPSLSAHPPRDQRLQLFRSLQPGCERRGGLRPRLPRSGHLALRAGISAKCSQLNGPGHRAVRCRPRTQSHRQELLRESRGLLSRGLWPQLCPAGSHLTRSRRCFVSGNPDSSSACGAPLGPAAPLAASSPHRAVPPAPRHRRQLTSAPAAGLE